MKQIPILFSTMMVQAILAGRKTMTRRTVKPQLNQNLHLNRDLIAEYNEGVTVKCPYGKPGDVLWVRESFREMKHGNDFRADYPDRVNFRWKPSIHMPRSAARIWLEVVSVRAERLLEISEADAVAEGILHHLEDGRARYKDYMADAGGYGDPLHDYPTVGIAKTSFCTLWESINGRESWIANPWVWVVEFKVLSTTGKPADL